MLNEKQLENYADVLLWGLKKARTQRYRKSDIIMVRFDLAALRLAEILQAKILGMGMNPLLRLNGTPAMDLNFYGMANRRQLVFQAPGSRELLSRLNGSIFLSAPESLTHLRSTDPKKIAMAAIAYKPLRDILNQRDERGAQNQVKQRHSQKIQHQEEGRVNRVAAEQHAQGGSDGYQGQDEEQNELNGHQHFLCSPLGLSPWDFPSPGWSG